METLDFKLRPLKPKHPIKLSEIQAWCVGYERNNRFPVGLCQRFMIGLYQIYQGLEWHDIDNRAESYMAAMLHFVMVSERLNVVIETEVFEDLAYVPYDYQEAKTLLMNISKASQQIIYRDFSKGRKRSGRYSEQKLKMSLAAVIMQLVRSVPVENRIQGIYDATTIMCGIL